MFFDEGFSAQRNNILKLKDSVQALLLIVTRLPIAIVNINTNASTTFKTSN